jgi:hypothetical protein
MVHAAGDVVVDLASAGIRSAASTLPAAMAASTQNTTTGPKK